MMNAKTQTHAAMGITGRGLPFLPLVLLLLFGSCGNQAAYQYRPSSEELNLKAVSKIEKAWVARHHYDHERRLLVPKVGGVKWGAVQEYKEDGTLVFRDWWERDRKIEDLEAAPSTAVSIPRQEEKEAASAPPLGLDSPIELPEASALPGPFPAPELPEPVGFPTDPTADGLPPLPPGDAGLPPVDALPALPAGEGGLPPIDGLPPLPSGQPVEPTVSPFEPLPGALPGSLTEPDPPPALPNDPPALPNDPPALPNDPPDAAEGAEVAPELPPMEEKEGELPPLPADPFAPAPLP